MESQSTIAANAALQANIANLNLDTVLPIRGGLSEDYKGTVKGIALVETGLKNDGVDAKPQEFDFNGQKISFPVGEVFRSIALTFTDGTNVAISSLRRSAKTTINKLPARTVTAQDMASWTGKVLHCKAVEMDKSLEQTRDVRNAKGEVTGTKLQSVKAFTIEVA